MSIQSFLSMETAWFGAMEKKELITYSMYTLFPWL